MGYRSDYILATLSPKDLVAALDLTPLGEADTVPTHQAWVGQLKTGWTVFETCQEGYASANADALRALSEEGDIFTCSVNEAVLASQASAYCNGQELWHIGFEADTNSGQPHAIKRGAVPVGAASEPFETPMYITEVVGGYRYDALFERGDFETLDLVRVPQNPHVKKGILSRMIERSPMATMIGGALLIIAVATPLGIGFVALLTSTIDFILGDWADICLSNCQR